jgi:predicted component of type VI protein secretion system
VQAHDDEMTAYDHFARSLPGNVILLIDTYDTEAAAEKVVALAPKLARQAVELVQRLRKMDLRKSPSISETLDWAKALVTLNSQNLDAQTLDTTLSVLLKHETDLQRVKQQAQSPAEKPRRVDDDRARINRRRN